MAVLRVGVMLGRDPDPRWGHAAPEMSWRRALVIVAVAAGLFVLYCVIVERALS